MTGRLSRLPRRLILMICVASLIGLTTGTLLPTPAKAVQQPLSLPFQAGHTWYICASYHAPHHTANYPLDIGWTSTSCNPGSTDTNGRIITAPSDGTVAYYSEPGDLLCINLDPGTGSMNLGHTTPVSGYAQAGAQFSRGTTIATVNNAGVRLNNNIAHLHLEVWTGDACTGASVPFDDAHAARFECAPDLTDQPGNYWGNPPTPLTPCSHPDKRHPFTDINGSPFYEDIVWLWEQGITYGCTPTTYCPTAGVTRDQMASFLSRYLSLPPTATDYFTDDEGSIHEDDINRIAAAGITFGCGGTNYCPSQVVTREVAATFLDRPLNLPTTTNDYFTDDNASIHQPAINRLAAAGITLGCAPGSFCPTAPATREQMAALLRRGEAYRP